MGNSLLDELIQRIDALDPEAQAAIEAEALAATKDMPWIPTPGPQTEAYFCQADELFYGGEAGGGKTSLLLGLSLTSHHRSLILRRQSKEAEELFIPLEEIIGHTDGRKMGTRPHWRIGDRIIDIGGCQYEQDKQKYKGIPHDHIAFDEIPDFTKSQFMFIKTWNRTTVPGQRSRIVCAGNPPTTAEGLWVIEYWAPWLDPRHPNPAKSGEIRHFIMDRDDRSHEVKRAGKYRIIHGDGELPIIEPVAEGEPEEKTEDIEIVRSRSRCFIRAGLADNPYLGEDYAANLDSLPAEIRAAYRDGKFDDAIKDDLWQCIPTDWIKAAQARWRPNPPQGVPMCAMGIDVAQGGPDNSIIAMRYDGWYDHNISIPGKQTPLGSDLAAVILAKRKDRAIPVVDMGGGYGGGVIQSLGGAGVEYYAYKGAETSHARPIGGKLKFKNKRAQAYWQFREALDPDQPGGSPIQLPDNPRLVADLTAPKFKIVGVEIVLEPKEDVTKRLGRSCDDGDAVVMAWFDGAKNLAHGQNRKQSAGPSVIMGRKNARRR